MLARWMHGWRLAVIAAVVLFVFVIYPMALLNHH